VEINKKDSNNIITFEKACHVLENSKLNKFIVKNGEFVALIWSNAFLIIGAPLAA
jgi:hypothetical protein